MALSEQIRQMIRAKRRSAPLRYVAKAAEKYLRAYYNEDFFRFDQNGEAFAMQCFSKWSANKDAFTIWDVGANAGQWAQMASVTFPAADIQSFEILPPIAEAFDARHAGNNRITLHRIGLSDHSGSVDVTWNRHHDQTSSISYCHSDRFGTDLATVSCPIKTADELIAEGLPAPLLLKIDTEGHDAPILRGAQGIVNGPNAPAMIQFEYGQTWIPARETLECTHAFLVKAGYSVGRLFPDHVDFKTYGYADDHFRMGNMIASREPDLTAMLRG